MSASTPTAWLGMYQSAKVGLKIRSFQSILIFRTQKLNCFFLTLKQSIKQPRNLCKRPWRPHVVEQEWNARLRYRRPLTTSSRIPWDVTPAWPLALHGVTPLETTGQVRQNQPQGIPKHSLFVQEQEIWGQLSESLEPQSRREM